MTKCQRSGMRWMVLYLKTSWYKLLKQYFSFVSILLLWPVNDVWRRPSCLFAVCQHRKSRTNHPTFFGLARIQNYCGNYSLTVLLSICVVTLSVSISCSVLLAFWTVEYQLQPAGRKFKCFYEDFWKKWLTERQKVWVSILLF